MTKAVNTFSVFLSYGAFILIFLAGYDFAGTFTLESITPLILKALFGAVLFWFSGMIIGDIVIRGIVEDIDAEKLDPLEGGFEQRIAEEKKKKRVVIIDKDLVKTINDEAAKKEIKIGDKKSSKDDKEDIEEAKIKEAKIKEIKSRYKKSEKGGKNKAKPKETKNRQ